MSADAVVVGGGIAGLAAARALAKAKRQVILIEARHRLGGRIHTERPKGWPSAVELGAQFVHDGNAELWKLLKESGTRVTKVPNLHWRSKDGDISKIRDLDQKISAVTGLIKERIAGKLSFAGYFKEHAYSIAPDSWDLAKGFVEGFEAAPMGQISARSLAGAEMDEQEQFIVPGGYDQVVAFLVSECLRLGVRIVEGAAVSSVSWSRSRVQVDAMDPGSAVCFRIGARYAVLALPLGVLQRRSGKGSVSFRPPLARKESAIAKMRMGHVVRITLLFSPSGWARMLPKVLRHGSPRVGFIHGSGPGFPTWWSLTPEPVMIGWAGGPDAAALRKLTARQKVNEAVRSLAKVLGVPRGVVSSAVTDSQEWDWNSDPYSRGTYSFIAAGQDNASRELARPVQDTLFFAGEATAEGAEVGTVHGALSSGIRAARQALSTGRPR